MFAINGEWAMTNSNPCCNWCFVVPASSLAGD